MAELNAKQEARDAYNASQNKNLYTEEDLLNFGAFVRIEDKKEKRLFLIQDYFKKWVEHYKKKYLITNQSKNL